MSIEIREGSILDFEGDAIVNPANGFLMHGAGLAKIIADAAQAVFQPEGVYPGSVAELKARVARDQAAARHWRGDQAGTPTIATGNVAVTTAGCLPYKGVIHAVGPVWNGGHFFEESLLRSAHTEACAAAHERRWRSIAFPAISCGLFGFPVDLAAPNAIEAVKFWADAQPNGMEMEVVFYPFGFEAEFTRALQEVIA